ncbi:TetR/AcrR family transcriptional regulator [Leucobacter denitrificans]|uniref:TetR/AcrR family transcriptional regulator n=1 Tax=Leucobacter denitrificans TaxID=683042 RepID=A0A7G9S2Q8_9MICO|nr:TetR/AcrR family transcriptional regulator [Leucobacter denitrificans]QNN62133.1 TetR/AcrR family transcriptional regulator [Leucobacter denitrificans]
MTAQNLERTAERNSTRTQRQILDAAAHVIGEVGTAMTLAQVAEAAGVSKGGLMHHYSGRLQLLIAVVDDANDRFREAVTGNLDLSENAPGKMLRAYVRTLCGGDLEAANYFGSAPIWNGLYGLPEIREVMDADTVWWEEQLALDGLDPLVIRMVRRAAEGLAAAYSYSEETKEDLQEARDLLLEMTVQGVGLHQVNAA